MGDRGNIIVKQSGLGEEAAPVWLYTHSGGYELADTLRRALARKQRWGDAPYLARIIFCEMLLGGEADLKGDTGFGISTVQCDNGYDFLIVDPEAQTVAVVSRKSEDPLNAKPRKQWSFEDFCKTTRNSPDKL